MPEPIEVKLFVLFRIGEIVYSRLDPERKGMVLGYDVRPDLTHYYVVWSDGEYSYNYEMQLSSEPNYKPSDQQGESP